MNRIMRGDAAALQRQIDGLRLQVTGGSASHTGKLSSAGARNVRLYTGLKQALLVWDAAPGVIGYQRYDIFRSFNGVQFDNIATVKATSYTDIPPLKTDSNGNPVDTTVFYKIQHTSVTGSFMSAVVEKTVPAIGPGDLKTAAITETAIKAGAITNGKIAVNAVSAGKIAAGAVTTEKLSANAVTANKIDVNIALIEKLFSQEIVIPPGGYIKSANDAWKIDEQSAIFAGWELDEKRLYSTSNNAEIKSDGTIRLGTGPSSVRLSAADSVWRLWAGGETPDMAPFKVSGAGDLIAKKGTIGKWGIIENDQYDELTSRAISNSGAPSGRGLTLDHRRSRVSIFSESYESVVSGILAGLPDRDGGVYGPEHRGYWIRPGDKAVWDGDVDIAGGAYRLSTDASYLIENGDTVVARLGTGSAYAPGETTPTDGLKGLILNEAQSGDGFRVAITPGRFFAGNDDHFLDMDCDGITFKMVTFKVSSLTTDIKGTLRVSSSGTVESLSSPMLLTTTAEGAGEISSDNDLLLQAASLGTVAIKADGAVGIGTSSPAYSLDVAGTGRFTGEVKADAFHLGLWGKHSGRFTTPGDVGTYYPVVFGSFNHTPYTLIVYRKYVHEDSYWRGGLVLHINGKASSWGNTPDYVKVVRNHNSGHDAKCADVRQDYRTSYVLVWLTGGTTFYYQGDSIKYVGAYTQWTSPKGDPPTTYTTLTTVKTDISGYENKIFTVGSNVGINTGAPAHSLDVCGDINTDSRYLVDNSYGTLDMGPQNSSWCHFYTDRPMYYFNKSLSVGGGKIGAYYGTLELQTKGDTRVTINGDKVGIGTKKPAYPLDIKGELRCTGNVRADSNVSIRDHLTVRGCLELGNNAFLYDDVYMGNRLLFSKEPPRRPAFGNPEYYGDGITSMFVQWKPFGSNTIKTDRVYIRAGRLCLSREQ